MKRKRDCSSSASSSTPEAEAGAALQLQVHGNFGLSYTFRVLLPNAANVVLTLHNPSQNMSVEDFVRIVKRKASQQHEQQVEGHRHIQWGPHVYLEDTLGNRLYDGAIIPSSALSSPNHPITLILQDGVLNSTHTFQDMWDVTPEPQLLVALPQEYTFETALADLIDNSLQAVWVNQPGERRLISINIHDGELSIFDSGQGMDGGKENSIAKWGTMGSSNHRAVRGQAIGGKPPYLRPFFGMYGYGGVTASMHLGGLAIVSSKTKVAKKVVTLRLEKDTLVRKSKADRVWRTAGDIRDVSQEERRMSPHGSFTKVYIGYLKSKHWNEDVLKCMLKDIYFPYIQNDEPYGLVVTRTPVEFEVNGINLTEVEGGEVVTTTLAANGPPFVLDLTLTRTCDAPRSTSESANARLSCFYFPILQGKETIDSVLEKLESDKLSFNESFETFSRVSIRRLGRLLPDARWGPLPFMEPKRKRGENPRIPQQCYRRVKCFVEADAGFVPTTSKTNLAQKDPFTIALKNLGRKGEMHDHTVHMMIKREHKAITSAQLDREYQEWLKAMHESYDEEVECLGDEAILILNPDNGRDLGLSNNVIRVLTQIRRRGALWKRGQKLKIVKGALQFKKDFYSTLEYILCEGLEGDPGEARIICRPSDCSDKDGSKVEFNNGLANFKLGNSKSLPLDLISIGKCLIVDDELWTKYLERMHLKAPSFIDILKSELVENLGLDTGFPLGKCVQAGLGLPKEIIVVLRPHSFIVDSTCKGVNAMDKKYIFNEPMEMRMEIMVINQMDVKDYHGTNVGINYRTEMKATSRNGFDGLYVFPMEGPPLQKILTTAGRYKFVFSLVGSLYPAVAPTEAELTIEPSHRMGQWKLSNQLGTSDSANLKTIAARLGSEFGPLYISCFDIYSNQMTFKDCPQVEIDVQCNGMSLGIKIEKAVATRVKDNMFVQLSNIVLGKGCLDLLRPTFEAVLKVSNNESCYAEMPLIVLPGEIHTVNIVNDHEINNIDGCLRPGDVLQYFWLQAKDAYGNPSERGQKIRFQLTGIKFQNHDDEYREVDDQGYVNLSGLLKVTGNYRSKALIHVSFGTQTLLLKEIQLPYRELRVISEIPSRLYGGSVLENIVFGIFDEKSQSDKMIDGRQHSLTVDMHSEILLQYPFKNGNCILPTLKIPEECGILEFKAFHSIHPELYVIIKVNVLPNPPLEMISVPGKILDGNAICNASEGDVASLTDSTRQVIVIEEIKAYIKSFLSDIAKWEADSKRLGMKVKEREDAVQRKRNDLSTVEQHLLLLQRDFDKCHHSSKGDVKGLSEKAILDTQKTLEEIKNQRGSAAALWVNFRMGHKNSHMMKEVIGIVALLARVEDDLLNRILSEFLGMENMLALVCKSHDAADTLEKYDDNGDLMSVGMHGLASEQNLKGRFRVICLDDIESYSGACNGEDPQKRLLIADPKSSAGDIPDGFIGYAVNLIILEPDNNCSLPISPKRLRGTLFFHLFQYLQVYKTRLHLYRAMPYIKDGAVSLDGAIVRQRGVLECGTREHVRVKFPVTSGVKLASSVNLKLGIEERLQGEKNALQKELNQAIDRLQQAKKKFSDKQKELDQRESQKNIFLERCQRQSLFIEDHELSG